MLVWVAGDGIIIILKKSTGKREQERRHENIKCYFHFGHSPTKNFFSGSAEGGERGRKPQDIRHVQEAKPVLEALSLNNLPVPSPALPSRLSDHIPLEPPCASAPFLNHHTDN